jgi:hypothetical protein
MGFRKDLLSLTHHLNAALDTDRLLMGGDGDKSATQKFLTINTAASKRPASIRPVCLPMAPLAADLWLLSLYVCGSLSSCVCMAILHLFQAISTQCCERFEKRGYCGVRILRLDGSQKGQGVTNTRRNRYWGYFDLPLSCLSAAPFLSRGQWFSRLYSAELVSCVAPVYFLSFDKALNVGVLVVSLHKGGDSLGAADHCCYSDDLGEKRAGEGKLKSFKTADKAFMIRTGSKVGTG